MGRACTRELRALRIIERGLRFSCARNSTLRACADRSGLSPSTTPGLLKVLDFGELEQHGDPLIQGIGLAPFEANEAMDRLESESQPESEAVVSALHLQLRSHTTLTRALHPVWAFGPK